MNSGAARKALPHEGHIPLHAISFMVDGFWPAQGAGAPAIRYPMASTLTNA